MSAGGDFLLSPETLAAQATAIDSSKSVWVSANAGSGKTFVLTRRVIRLLLDGVEPSRILCLTYTKAAAANMQNRIFAELAAWVALPDAELAASIRKITEDDGQPARLAKARRLFAEAVETPGGLRIQTIHAFCEQLLHVFPLEANVPANFSVIEETEAQALLAEAIEETLRLALDGGSIAMAAALSRVAQDVGLDGLASLLPSVAGRQGHIADIRARLGLGVAETVETIDRQTIMDGISPDEWPDIIAILKTSSSKSDQDAAGRLSAAIARSESDAKADAYRAFFLTQSMEPRSRLVTKAVATAAPGLVDQLTNEQGRVLALLDRRRAAAAAERTEALLLIAQDVSERLRLKKLRRALLDFDDLIERTATLLERAESAWVLFKLDGGIDHLLVDEAQDTSPAQWTILKALTADFFAGETANRRNRSVFAVGDEKQSIYSFQGADPREFGAARAHFQKAVTDIGSGFSAVELKMSFRSAQDVLGAVDVVFADPARRKGLSADDVPTVHDTARRNAAGLVEVWPPEVAEKVEESFSDKGIDVPVEWSPEVRLAKRIAGRIAFWRKQAAVFEDDGKPITPGDIMILVRRRNAFFEAVIKALKQEHVPVAGADRLTLTDHIAVMDLIALGQVMLLPEDDLTLATLLKSPLCGLDDEDLMLLAPQRMGSLWEGLRSSGVSKHRAVAEKLKVWRALAAEKDCFGFYATVLGRDRGRHDLLKRLGPDAGEAIDVFLADALDYGPKNPASLSGFLTSVIAENRTVKRDMDAAGNAVRVMTVHASKGLEARIVFLADTFSQPMAQHDSPLIRLEADPDASLPSALIWAPGAKSDPSLVRAERERRREASWDEYRRLLYVAMTRARDRLYVGGYRGTREVKTPVWYAMIETALGEGEASTVLAEDGSGEVLQWRSAGTTHRSTPVVVPAVQSPGLDKTLPGWLHKSVPAEVSPLPPLRPSTRPQTVETASPEARPTDHSARLRGVLLHRLFELLPDVQPARRREAGLALIKRHPFENGADLVKIVLDALDDPLAASIFGLGSRSEVAISGAIPGQNGESIGISGQIDRLVVGAGEVLVCDIKTERAPGDPRNIPANVMRQLAAYRALLQQIYPGRIVRCFILWISLARLVEAQQAGLDASAAALIGEHAAAVRYVTQH